MRTPFKIQILILLLYLFFISCSKDSSSVVSSDTGAGGSTARFTVVGDYLYTVNEYSLKLFNISDPKKPLPVSNINLGFGIETVFPYQNAIFIGTQQGMYIYDITTPNLPVQLSYFQHVFSCDPVVVQDGYAYITLNSENTWCNGRNNLLQIVNVQDLRHPTLVKQYPMAHPRGLGVDNKTLFVCDEGLKVYDATNPTQLVFSKQFFIQADDVIPLGNILLVIGKDGLYQYSYSGTNVTLLSKIDILADYYSSIKK